jgi:hypothetical protein
VKHEADVLCGRCAAESICAPQPRFACIQSVVGLRLPSSYLEYLLTFISSLVVVHEAFANRCVSYYRFGLVFTILSCPGSKLRLMDEKGLPGVFLAIPLLIARLRIAI